MTKFGVGLGLVLYFAFALGFTFFKYWNWFVLPVFPELPEISYHQAVGLQVFLTLFNVSTKRDLKEEYYAEDKTNYLILRLIIPWLLLFVGWIIHLFI